MSAPPTLREDSPVFDWAGETARRVGTLVHAELQVMNLASSDEEAIRARHPHFRRWLALHGVPSDRLQEDCSATACWPREWAPSRCVWVCIFRSCGRGASGRRHRSGGAIHR